MQRTLGSSFIPVAQAHRYHWWEPVRDAGPPTRPWYYWTPRDRGDPAGASRVDEQALDPSLRPIVAWALTRGWQTTPSCEGHFYDPRDTDDRGRASDSRSLRRGALTLRHTETGEAVRPHIPHWEGAHPTETRVMLAAESGKGCVGIRPVGERLDAARLHVPGYVYTTTTPDGLTLILTVAKHPSEVEGLWREVFQRLREAVR